MKHIALVVMLVLSGCVQAGHSQYPQDTSYHNEPDTGALIGAGLGAWGGVALCDGNTASNIICGLAGAAIGSSLLSQRDNSSSRNHLQRPPPFIRCKEIEFYGPDGRLFFAVACPDGLGGFDLLQVHPF